MKYSVSDADFDTLGKIVFASATLPGWQDAVWKGRRGILDSTPLATNVVEGPMLKNWRAMTADPASASSAIGFGQQTLWLSPEAIAILEKVKPIIVGPQ